MGRIWWIFRLKDSTAKHLNIECSPLHIPTNGQAFKTFHRATDTGFSDTYIYTYSNTCLFMNIAIG